MARQLSPLWLVASCCLAGCLSAPLIDVTARKPPHASNDEEVPTKSDPHDPAERQQMLASIDHELIGEMITETPVGSHVSIVVNGNQQYIGTLVRKQAGSLELLNCVSHETVPGPNGIRQCKTSHTPLLAFKTTELSRFTALSPPRPGFKAPDITEDASGATVIELVYKDGTRWSKRVAAGLDTPATVAKHDEGVPVSQIGNAE